MTLLLIVDDEPVALEFMADLLHYFGYATLSARDASEALRLLEANRPRTAIIDLALPPPTTGWQLAERIHERFPEMTCVAVTAYDSSFVQKQVRVSRFAAYFTKPIDSSAFRQFLATL